MPDLDYTHLNEIAHANLTLILHRHIFIRLPEVPGGARGILLKKRKI